MNKDGDSQKTLVNAGFLSLPHFSFGLRDECFMLAATIDVKGMPKSSHKRRLANIIKKFEPRMQLTVKRPIGIHKWI